MINRARAVTVLPLRVGAFVQSLGLAFPPPRVQKTFAQRRWVCMFGAGLGAACLSRLSNVQMTSSCVCVCRKKRDDVRIECLLTFDGHVFRSINDSLIAITSAQRRCKATKDLAENPWSWETYRPRRNTSHARRGVVREFTAKNSPRAVSRSPCEASLPFVRHHSGCCNVPPSPFPNGIIYCCVCCVCLDAPSRTFAIACPVDGVRWSEVSTYIQCYIQLVHSERFKKNRRPSRIHTLPCACRTGKSIRA